MKATRRVAVWEERLGIPAKEWAGRCYEIAYLGVEKGLLPKRAVYGLWTGPVHPESMFAERKRTAGVCRHGWVRSLGGVIYVPYEASTCPGI